MKILRDTALWKKVSLFWSVQSCTVAFNIDGFWNSYLLYINFVDDWNREAFLLYIKCTLFRSVLFSVFSFSWNICLKKKFNKKQRFDWSHYLWSQVNLNISPTLIYFSSAGTFHTLDGFKYTPSFDLLPLR